MSRVDGTMMGVDGATVTHSQTDPPKIVKMWAHYEMPFTFNVTLDADETPPAGAEFEEAEFDDPEVVFTLKSPPTVTPGPPGTYDLQFVLDVAFPVRKKQQ